MVIQTARHLNKCRVDNFKGSKMPKLGLLVVGQSPRAEVEKEFERLVSGVQLDLRGCLDGLTRAEIDQLAPGAGETTLFTRLPDGAGVALSKAAVTKHGMAQLDALEKSGADAVVVLCTGDFPAWADRRVLFPSLIIRSFVKGVRPKGHLGIFSPLENQLEDARGRWTEAGYQVTARALSPNASLAEAQAAGKKMARATPDLLVLDCISYTAEIKQAVCAAARTPAVLAITAIARNAAELLEGL